MLDVDITHRANTFVLDARFKSAEGTTALLGRSGAGKTTLVNVVAGLVRPDRAKIVFDGETWVDTQRGVLLASHRRRVGVVFQEARLFPHLSVKQNLLYGRWVGRTRGDAGEFSHIVDMLGIGALLDRRPRDLSGGEKQRVALGRALLSRPRLLLMDEPLAALDEARKAEILPYIERLRDEARVPIVYVSHSIPEVTRLADAVVLLDAGRVVAVGPIAEIMARVDLFPLTGRAEAGVVLDARVDCHDDIAGLTMLTTRTGSLRMPRADVAVGQSLRVRIRARDVLIAIEAPRGLSALNVFEGMIAAVSAGDAPIVDVRIECGDDHATEAIVARITRHSFERLGLAIGVRVFAVVKGIAFDRRAVSANLAHNPPPIVDAHAD